MATDNTNSSSESGCRRMDDSQASGLQAVLLHGPRDCILPTGVSRARNFRWMRGPPSRRFDSDTRCGSARAASHRPLARTRVHLLGPASQLRRTNFHIPGNCVNGTFNSSRWCKRRTASILNAASNFRRSSYLAMETPRTRNPYRVRLGIYRIGSAPARWRSCYAWRQRFHRYVTGPRRQLVLDKLRVSLHLLRDYLS